MDNEQNIYAVVKRFADTDEYVAIRALSRDEILSILQQYSGTDISKVTEIIMLLSAIVHEFVVNIDK